MSAAAESETGSRWAPSRNDGPTGSHGSASEEVTATPDLELKLPARAENVAVVRHAFGGFAEVLTVDEQTLADIKLAVTEACTNVVIHAYDDDAPGSLEVDASFDDTRLTVVIRDRGRGIVPRPDSPGLGLGLPLIATLAESLELGTDDARPHRGPHDLPHRRGRRGSVSLDPGHQRGLRRPGPRAARRARARVASSGSSRRAPTARSTASTTRCSSRTRSPRKAGSFAEDGRVNVRVVAEQGSVELHVGPLREDGASALIASASLPGIGNVLERVADELEPQPGSNGNDEYLRIRLGFGAQSTSTKAPEEADAP